MTDALAALGNFAARRGSRLCRTLLWRWTAFRTGQSFAEIVALKTLIFRVEQVFLIHAESGLLLQHAMPPRSGTGRDAHQVSGMLIAISNFVSDSFSTESGELNAFTVGDLSVWLERGPHAIIAGVVRGTASDTVPATFHDAIEQIHRKFGRELREFNGDSSRFELARPVLEACLVAEFTPH